MESNPFRLPPDYFDTFSDKVNSGIEAESVPLHKRIRRIAKPIIILAAAMLVLLFIIQQTVNVLKIDTNNKPLSEEQTLILNLELWDISEEMLIEELYAENQDKVGREDLIEYLVDENIELSDIIKHL